VDCEFPIDDEQTLDENGLPLIGSKLHCTSEGFVIDTSLQLIDGNLNLQKRFTQLLSNEH
jgi:hypothetical protein